MGKGKSPAWSLNGSSCPDIPNELSRWEKFIEAEHLEDKDLKNNKKVLDFILNNYRQYYVPTKVLRMYGREWSDA